MEIKVAIVEDTEETLSGLQEMLNSSSDFLCVGTFDNAESFIKSFDTMLVDVVLMDINLPGMSGIECIDLLKEKNPKVQFLVVTNYEDSEKIFTALSVGATGYLLKNTAENKLHNAIKDIYQGGSPMSMQVARKIVNSFSGRYKNKELFNSLTNREKQVLEHLDKGFLYKEIAEKLDIKLETVRSYIRCIYEKLHVHSRTDALNKIYNKNYIY